MKPKKVKDKIDSDSDSASISEQKPVASPLQTMEEFGADALERAVVQLRHVVQTVAKNPAINRREAIDALEQLVEFTKAEIDELTPSIPSTATKLWKERGHSHLHMSAASFLIENYPSLGFGLTLNHVGKLDPALKLALSRERRTKPESKKLYDLPTQDEYYTRRISELSEIDQIDIMRLGDVIRKRRKRSG